jgi:hypothetical protein
VYGCSIFRVDRWSSNCCINEAKKYDNDSLCFCLECIKGSFSLSTKMTFTVVQYLGIFYVKERRPCWMAFSHLSLKSDPRMITTRSLSCVRILENICNSGKTSKIANFFLVEKPVVILENICKCFLVDFFVTAPVFQTKIARRPIAMSQTTRTSST